MDNQQSMPVMMSSGLSLGDVLRKVVNYIVEGLAVAVACYVIPQRKMTAKEIVLIALTASAIFGVLDVFSPRTGQAVRSGVGLGVGLGLSGVGGLNLSNPTAHLA